MRLKSYLKLKLNQAIGQHEIEIRRLKTELENCDKEWTWRDFEVRIWNAWESDGGKSVKVRFYGLPIKTAIAAAEERWRELNVGQLLPHENAYSVDAIMSNETSVPLPRKFWAQYISR